ncbi:hypothetical protein R8Z50_26225 [Longispora sp. K20-0274]|uniref:hypothetical protein n=1 Tax=Longispora sp. K20-0274 TaxID=3088255 RepID=UPI00399AAB71
MLERRYRALLRAYPSEFRVERGEELVATLLDGTRPGQRWPAPGDVADMLGSGLRRRLGLDRHAAAEVGLRRAAPVALVLLAALSASVLYRLVPGSDGLPSGVNWFVTGVAVGWLAVVLCWAVLPRAAGRVVLGVALAATVVGQFVAGVLPPRNGPGSETLSLFPHHFLLFVLLGALALLGTRDRGAPLGVRFVVVVGSALAVAGTWLWITVVGNSTTVFGSYFLAPWEAGPEAILGLVTLVVLTVAGVRARRGGDRGWLWTAVLLLVPLAGMTLPMLIVGYGDGLLLSLGALRGPVSPLVLLAAVGVVVAALRWGVLRPLGAGSVTTVALGFGAAFSVVLGPYHAVQGQRSILVGYALVLLAAAAWRWWPVATPYLVVAASAVFLLWAVRHPDRATLALAGALLAPVALTGVRDRPARPAVWPAGVVALLVAPLLFTVSDIVEVAPITAAGGGRGTAPVVGYLATTLPDLMVVPCAMAVLVGVDRVTRAAPGWGWALVGLAGGGTWFVLVTVRDSLPASAALIVAAGAGLLLARRFRARTVGSATDTEAVS